MIQLHSNPFFRTPNFRQAYRTGRLAHLRRAVFAQVFNAPIADKQACVFVEPGVIEQLEAMVAPAH